MRGPAQDTPSARHRHTVRGAVQGVGFRPFVHRLASELGLSGWVHNGPQGVRCEVEGSAPDLLAFAARLQREHPVGARLSAVEQESVPVLGDTTAFQIRPSEVGSPQTAWAPPDLATCDACLAELRDPTDRRFRYPFLTCTDCGPRYSILESLPYDRTTTTMHAFPLCPECLREFHDPRDRRFRAETIACPTCGPSLELLEPTGRSLATRGDALDLLVRELRQGAIAAVKGVGGFHLMVDARDDEAVRRLRARKGREEKPFAVLYPTLATARAHLCLDPDEERLLSSREAPIVLAQRKGDDLAPSVAPGCAVLGVFLPSNPLHHLIASDGQIPLVATSGNRSEEPIAIGNDEARARLGGLADVFLVHDRSITRPVDDSIARVVAGRPLLLRRARGFAPLPVEVPQDLPPALAVGGHLKNAIAIGAGRRVFPSQHLGDLGSEAALAAFRTTVAALPRLLGLRADRVVCDAHPDYASTLEAGRMGLPRSSVQHHAAHVLACMADNGLESPVLGIAWDGAGLGPDGTLWGGETLLVNSGQIHRAGHLRTFPLVGGDRAAREPRRAALGLLFERFGEEIPRDLAPVRAFSSAELGVVLCALRGGATTVRTSSAGRLFDGIASLLGLHQVCSYEGQAAMALEAAAMQSSDGFAYPCTEDWGPMLDGIIDDLRRDLPVHRIAARVHNALAEAIVTMARRIGEPRVLLTGGCFQNRRLTETAVRRLAEEGFGPYWHRQLPPNDGGIAVGQLMALGI